LQRFPAKVSFAPHPPQHLSSLIFLIIAISTAMMLWWLILIFICIFLRKNSLKHFPISVPYLYFFFWEVSILVLYLFFKCEYLFSSWVVLIYLK
jgi:ABC-type transport system involved in cytochrome c biogenesis permease subunit